MTNLNSLLDAVASEATIPSDARKRLKCLQQLLVNSQNDKDSTINRLQQQLQRKTKLAEKYVRIQPLLLQLDEVLGKIANDTVNQEFQELYDNYIRVKARMERRECEPLTDERTLRQQLHEEQMKRLKAQNDIELICQGSRQTFILKDLRVKQLEKTVSYLSTELASLTERHKDCSKIMHEQSMRVEHLEQQILKVSDTSINQHLDPTCTTLNDSRLKISKSPKASQMIEPVMSPRSTSRSKGYPPIPPSSPTLPPLAPTPNLKRQMSGGDAQDPLWRLLLVQAGCIEQILSTKV